MILVGEVKYFCCNFLGYFYNFYYMLIFFMLFFEVYVLLIYQGYNEFEFYKCENSNLHWIFMHKKFGEDCLQILKLSL